MRFLKINDSHSTKKNIVLFLFMSIFLIKGIFYAVYITPPLLNTSPDDVGHISYIQYLASERKLPILFETTLEDSSHRLFEAYGEVRNVSFKNILVTEEKFIKDNSINWIVQHPPLYYLIMTPVYLITKLFTSQLSMIIIVLRLATIPLGLACIYVINKLMDILKVRNTVRYCILSCFVFSMPIQYYFSNITNDSLLIFLCILTLYFLLRYTIKYQVKDYNIFVVCCALIVMTKYTGALILLGYVAYFIYKSLKKTGLKTTIKLCVRGGILGALIVSPVFIRNFLLYGNPVALAGAQPPLHDITYLQFIREKGYIDLLYQACLALVGWGNLIVADYRLKWISAFILSSLAFLCILKVTNKTVKLMTFYSCLISVYILFHILTIGLSAIISIISFFIISIYLTTAQSMELNRKEVNIFFFGTIVLVFLVFMFKHYEICLNRGYVAAVSGRYYYIAIFPFQYLIFNVLEEYKFKYTKYIPILITSILMSFEVQTIVRCIEKW
ncbi:MAG TPA: glycosyltransferase family 39 protein [Gallicola sp.]|nr:glycosyltransferase family 39 protein [Gallicola sp.]